MASENKTCTIVISITRLKGFKEIKTLLLIEAFDN